MMVVPVKRKNKVFSSIILSIFTAASTLFLLSVIGTIEKNNNIFFVDVIIAYLSMMIINAGIRKWSGKKAFESKKDIQRKIIISIASAVGYILSIYYSISYAVSNGGLIIDSIGVSFTWLFVQVYISTWVFSSIFIYLIAYLLVPYK